MHGRLVLFIGIALTSYMALADADPDMAKQLAGLDKLMAMALSTPQELELARQGVAEAQIEKAWDRPCPYEQLERNQQGPQTLYRCERWDDCVEVSAETSLFTEAFYRNHQSQPGDTIIPWEMMRDGRAFLLDASDLDEAYAKGHLLRHALKFADENWRLFEGRDPAKASELVEDKFWRWCSVEPLSIWQNQEF